MRHTDTPWQIKNDVDGETVIIANVDGESFSDGTASYSYDVVANLEWDEMGDIADRPQAAANAAFIVAAVNSHDQLVEALTALVRVVRTYNADGPIDITMSAGGYRDADDNMVFWSMPNILAQADAALSQAQGEKPE